VCVNSARAAAVWACEPFLYRGGGRERGVCVCVNLNLARAAFAAAV